MNELEQEIWNLVHSWCDGQANEIPDQNRRYLMDQIKALVLSEDQRGSKKLVCDVCGSNDVIESPHMGRNCNQCHPL